MKKIEVSMTDMFIAVLRRWWIILISIVLVVGLVYVLQQTNNGDNSAYQKELADYEVALKNYNDRIASYDRDIGDAKYMAAPYQRIRLQALQYIWESPLLQVNPFDANMDYLTISITSESPYESQFNADYLIDIVEKMSLQDVLGNSYPEGVQEKHMKEIIRTKRINDNMVSVQCYNIGNEAIDSKQVVEKIFLFLQKRTEEELSSIKLQEIDAGIANAVDLDLENYRIERVNNISKYDQEYLKVAIKIEQLEEAKYLYAANNRPSEPVLIGGGQRNIILSAAFGAVITVLGIIIYYVMRIPVLTSNQIRRQLGIKWLGNIKSGRINNQSKDECYQLVVQNIKETDKNLRGILLIGSGVPQADIEKITNSLNGVSEPDDLSFSSGTDLFESAETVKMLNTVDGVIVVAKRDKSTIRLINQQYERILESPAKVVGYVFIDGN